MPIFKDTSGALKKLNTLPLDKEKNFQKLVKDNLMEVLELRYLATEYVTTFGGRIDTLAVNATTGRWTGGCTSIRPTILNMS